MVPTYGESLRIGWTILWRGVGSVMLLLMFVNGLIITGMPELSRASPSWGAMFFPLALSGLIGAFVIMPWLVKRLCTTSYPGFRLRLEHESSASQT